MYLSWRAQDVGSALPMVDLARASSAETPIRLADRVIADIETRLGKPAGSARILLLGIAYKKDVEDTRVSPALTILRHLEKRGATVDYHDPFFPVMPMTRDHADLAGRESVILDAGTLGGYDAALVTTDHSDVDYALVAERVPLVFDSRNVFDSRGIVIDRGRLVKV
ncbi:MAG: hypothetical protein JNK88_10145 [Mangrovicoccus sp.]|nr:hypothetical protein [Mangrovicoccus sp.]